MNQPTDRLGQPLSVGDWVEFNEDAAPQNKNNGSRWQVTDFLGEYLATNKISGYTRRVILVRLSCKENAISDCITKINPKPETTTWDKCVFVPESLTLNPS